MPDGPGQVRWLEGREYERAALSAELDRARAGRGGLVVVSGEPGIGKSALLEDLAVTARSAGTTVAWGTCWDGDGAPELWPWQRILNELEHHPDLSADDDVGRFALFDRVTRMLAESQRVLVVVDDVQWADASCVRLMRYAARELRTSSVLIAAACRTAALAGPVREMVADTATRLHLTLAGIDESAIAAVLATETGTPPDPRRVASIAERSGGNPFFVHQLAGVRRASTGSERLPAAAEEVVAARVLTLPEALRGALGTAALIGRRFEDALLVAAHGDAVDLGPAVTAGLVEPAGPQAHRFVHDLVREHLATSLEPADARCRHLEIATALVDSDAEMRTSRLAHHAVLAVPELAADEAARWCRDAAEEAARLRSYDDVARHLRAAARLDPDPAQRLDLADALLRGGHRDEARGLYAGVRVEDPVAAARAAIGLHESGIPIDEDHRHVVAALDAARLALGDSEPELRARVTAALARELADGPLVDQSRADALASSALALARSTGDPATTAACLYARHDVVWGPGTAIERVSLGTQLAEVARAAGDLGLDIVADMTFPHVHFRLEGKAAFDHGRNRVSDEPWGLAPYDVLPTPDGFVAVVGVTARTPGSAMRSHTVSVVTLGAGRVVRVQHWCSGAL